MTHVNEERGVTDTSDGAEVTHVNEVTGVTEVTGTLGGVPEMAEAVPKMAGAGNATVNSVRPRNDTAFMLPCRRCPWKLGQVSCADGRDSL